VAEVIASPSFWRSKRVLVTGHTGFKGSWLALWLQQMGAEVLGYSSGVPTTPSLFEMAGVADGMQAVEGDVADADLLADTVARHRPEIVVHGAAQSLVRASYQSPVETFRTNVLGTVNLLDAVRQHATARVVLNVTSDKSYLNANPADPCREDDPLGGSDPYSASKACAEWVATAYRSSFFSDATTDVALASVRAGNVVGGGDWAADRIVADAMRAAASGDILLVRHPDAIRPWQYVLDCLNGYLVLAERLWEDPTLAGAWNFGPDEADVRPVRWIADELVRLWGPGLTWVHDEAEGPHEAPRLRLDSSRARAALGWRPRVPIGEALALTSEWYRAANSPVVARRITIEQLDAYAGAGRSAACDG
jgi:CDP-glucose 4,6-dehydratase